MSRSREGRPPGDPVGLTDEAVATALQIGCILAFAAFWSLLAWPAVFGSWGTWWTRLLEVFGGSWMFDIVAGAPIVIVFLVACRLRRPALLACTLAAGVTIVAVEVSFYIAPHMRLASGQGASNFDLLAGLFLEYGALAVLTIVLGLLTVVDQVSGARRRASDRRCAS